MKDSPTRAEGRDIFLELFKSWSHNPVSTLSLCLLAQNYDLAAGLVMLLYVLGVREGGGGVIIVDLTLVHSPTSGDVEVTVAFLLQIDKLVQLLESPVFVRAWGRGTKPLLTLFRVM